MHSSTVLYVYCVASSQQTYKKNLMRARYGLVHGFSSIYLFSGYGEKDRIHECQLEPKHDLGNDRRIKHLSMLGIMFIN
jgi:hypothetical protein